MLPSRFFVRAERALGGADTGARDQRGPGEASGETLASVDMGNKAHGGSKPSMNAGSCLSNGSILDSQMWTQPLSPLLSSFPGLIPPPQWWMRGIRNASICMAEYLQRGSRVSAQPAPQKYW